MTFTEKLPAHSGPNADNRLPGRHNPQLLLGTDLDGTLLGGTEDDRAELFGFLGNHDAGACLVFCTGRGLETVLPLLTDPALRAPDYIIADVGATVLRGDDLEPVQPLQHEIASRWPGTHTVLNALKRFPYLVRQDVPQERRCSFLVEDDSLIDDDLRKVVRELDCELVFSAGQYLDVLPRGVSKGSTLTALVEQLEISADRVVVAGDTLNDLSMFETPFRGIVVGQAEPALVTQVRDREHVFVASRPGAGGISEGLTHFGFSPLPAREEAPTAAPQDDTRTDNDQLLLLYHRLPFDEVRRHGVTERRQPKSPNGIIPSLLGLFADGRKGTWVAWSRQDNRTPEGFKPNVPIDEQRYPHLEASRIALTNDDIDLFYKRFAKEAFWPIIFSFPSKATFREHDWEHFVEINKAFAERTAEEANTGATVWIHDYNLWMVPGFLRHLRSDLRIAFFHHTAFPPPDIFNIVPWHRQIVGSLLKCDYIGFHIPRYVENFVDVVRSYGPIDRLERTQCAPRFVTYGCALGIDTMTTELETGGQTVYLGAHPVGVDVSRIEQILAQPQTQQRIERIQQELGGRRCVLSVERLDYVKGPLEKIRAFERLLERQPELQGQLTFVNIVTPPAPGMGAYHHIRQQLDEAVGRVNGRFAKIDWTPIRYFYRSVPFEDVVAYYASADVVWITPLRDGLNLVAKEYIVARGAHTGDGVVVLSEFAGAAVELFGALLTSPYHGEEMAQDLLRALTMDPQERRERMRRLRDIVYANDVVSWGEGFIDAVRRRVPC